MHPKATIAAVEHRLSCTPDKSNDSRGCCRKDTSSQHSLLYRYAQGSTDCCTDKFKAVQYTAQVCLGPAQAAVERICTDAAQAAAQVGARQTCPKAA